MDLIVVQSLAKMFVEAFKNSILGWSPTARLKNEGARQFGEKHPEMSGLRLHRFTVVLEQVLVDFNVRESPDGTDLAADLKTRDFSVNCFYLFMDLSNENKSLRIFYSEKVSSFNTNLTLDQKIIFSFFSWTIIF